MPDDELNTPSPSHHSAIKRAEWISRIFDSAIQVPGTDLRIGLDPVIGLIPGIGDAISTIASGALILDAARLGVSNSVLFRMLSNLLIDSLVGAIPLFGDLFDFAWKANLRNLELLRHAKLNTVVSGDPIGRIRVMLLISIGAFIVLLIALIVGITLAMLKLFFSL
ncbi:MAG: DUF4112 domain-containing protein [Deltaproteobacteria bacterium]|nr:DUF4112 domain-containing protein [Deltaproteobacteria bacterium]